MLNVGYIYPSSEALGPGKRFCLWLRGCNRQCPGCASPELLNDAPNNFIEIEEIYSIITNQTDIFGITVSGGEPMLQYEELGRLLQKIKTGRPDLNVIVYTGFTLEQMPLEVVNTITPYVDLLIDGEYVRELNDDKGIRGSSNQKFHYFSDALKPFAEEMENGTRKREIHLIDELETLTIGIGPSRNSNYGTK